VEVWDPAFPQRGSWWMTIGGGVEADETPAQAAVREAIEEVRLAVEGVLLPALYARTSAFHYDGVDYEQREYYFSARLEASELERAVAERSEWEQSVLACRCWPEAEISVNYRDMRPPNLLDIVRLAKLRLQQALA
jgi:8-oxo-dGTP pyrophosphatase MutT (NUDIX family)